MKQGANRRIATVDRNIGVVSILNSFRIFLLALHTGMQAGTRRLTRHPPLQVSSGLIPDGKHFTTRAREEAAEWRNFYKAPIPISSLADRMGSYVQIYTLYNSVRPFGITAIVGGWDGENEPPVDGQVGSGPSTGAGGKVAGKVREGGPGLYMIEPSGLFWVCQDLLRTSRCAYRRLQARRGMI